ncbi:MAG: DnaD domain protein [Lachnospiraceae bacterium]|nr:DnaD domain protein [Lachnospiraceae bacterium]
MAQILLKTQTRGSFLVSCEFIDKYISEMNEAQVKIYLYLLRCTGDNIPVTVTSIADKFNYMEADITRALLYLDKTGLLSVEYDDKGNVVSICVNDCDVSPVPAPALPSGRTVAPLRTDAPASVSPTRHFYPVDTLEQFKERADVKRLMYMTQLLLKRTLSATDTYTLLYIYDSLHFPIDLIEYLVDYCVNCGGTTMDYIESVALSWAGAGITTVQQARLTAGSGRYHKECYTVLKALGITGRSVVPDDSAYLARWIDRYGMDLDTIVEACRRTISQINKPSFQYVDSILKGWHEAGIHHKDDIKAADDAFKAAKKNRPAPSQTRSSAAPNRFNNFNQRNTDLDALTEQILQKQTPF